MHTQAQTYTRTRRRRRIAQPSSHARARARFLILPYITSPFVYSGCMRSRVSGSRRKFNWSRKCTRAAPTLVSRAFLRDLIEKFSRRYRASVCTLQTIFRGELFPRNHVTSHSVEFQLANGIYDLITRRGCAGFRSGHLCWRD